MTSQELGKIMKHYNLNAEKEWSKVVDAVNKYIEEGGVFDAMFDPAASREIDAPAMATAWIYSRLEGKGWAKGMSGKIRQALGYTTHLI